ncbi:MAG: hypothetical protein EHM12_11370 [Dehalococcoidia bacterium]|nr:MAG: hypothetical protein EHM12_11370 [Dehalococcoidia bacterium]
MNYGKRELNPLSIADYEHGLNDTERVSDVGKAYFQRYPRHHCVQCNNVVLDQMKHRPGSEAIKSDISGRLWGMDFYKQDNGSETLLVVVGQKLYSQNTSNGTLTELYDFGGSGETYFQTFANKCWITNSKNVIKIEGTTAYQVGITPPTGVVATASAGGSLPDGVYQIYVSYSRYSGGINLLFSLGQNIASVTLGTGNNTIAITNFANSSDPQVGNKVVWMTDAGGSLFYLYYQTTNNTTTAFNITSASGKSTAFTYDIYAATNYVPGAFEYICVFDKRVWGSIGNTLYYSLQQGNVYDLERFDTSSDFIIMPYPIEGIFQLNGYIYLNTKFGLIKQAPDPYSRYEIIGSGNITPTYFRYPRTVASDGSSLMGVTNKGFHIFDGDKWYTNDFSKNIKTSINNLYSCSTTYFWPAATIATRSNRTEYHLLYKDTTSGTMNNRRLVLNITKTQILDKEDFIAPWEMWDNSGNYIAVNSSNNVYVGQNHSTTSVVYKEQTSTCQDINIYIGNTLTAQRNIPYLIRTGTITPELDSITKWENIRILAHFLRSFYVRIQPVNKSEIDIESELIPTLQNTVEGFILDESVLDVDTFGGMGDEPQRYRLPGGRKGYSFYVEITQTEDDKDFQLMELDLHGYLTRGRMI